MVVGNFQRLRHREADRHSFPPGERAAAAENLLQTLPPHQFHGEVGLVVLLTIGEQLHDAGMAQSLERVDLGTKPRPQAGVIDQMGRQHLHRHSGAGGGVGRLIDSPHPPAAQARSDAVRS